MKMTESATEQSTANACLSASSWSQNHNIYSEIQHALL